MSDEIKKHKFRKNTDFGIEVVPLAALTKVNRVNLVTPHRTNFYHVFLFEDCQPTHFIDFEPIRIKPYSLLFIDKDRVHQFDELLNYEGSVLIFTDDFFSTNDSDTKFLRSSILFNDLSDNKSITLSKSDFERFVSICETVTDELNQPNDHVKHSILKNLLHNFLLLAEREKRKQGFVSLEKGVDLDYTLLFRDLLESNFTQLKAVSDYASRIFISEKRLGQATSIVLGKTPKEMINERVLLEAKRLLVHSNLSIKEIGLSLGFEDSAYFVRFFRKNAETTPVEFREQHLKK
ncbi:MAG: helix-turn-helix domain-containing protein [Bacteroidales bacterium]|nr:helix-turn-helix domain-containing protein [Bacteroidales bacterium]